MWNINKSIVLLLIIGASDGARILGIVPSPSYSHQIVFQPLWTQLSLRGHEVVVITTDPMNNKTLTNLTEINVGFTYKLKEDYNQRMTNNSSNLFEIFRRHFDLTANLMEAQLSHPDVKAIIESKKGFDLLMYEFNYPVFQALKFKFNCPSIALLSVEIPADVQWELGNYLHPSLYPNIGLPFYTNLTFMQRLINFVTKLFAGFGVFGAYFININNDAIKKHLGPNMPELNNVIAGNDLIFSNANPAFSLVKALVPTIIEFGSGVHIQPQKPLTKDLLDFLQTDKGVVYFSLGSNVKSKYLSDEIRQVFLNTFSELPLKVLWKFEDESMLNVPDNVKIIKWAPQQDVLRHPSVKVFVTQCGIQSLEEALYSHVPIVGIPFQGDQMSNAVMLEHIGIGKFIPKEKLNKEILKQTIMDVATNRNYKERQIELARLSRDQPLVGTDKLVWWTEYAIRNNGAKHLRSPMLDLPTYQYYMLDIFGFILLVLLVLIALIYTFLKMVIYFVNIIRRKIKID